MRLIIHYVEYSNFLSTGKQKVRVDLDSTSKTVVYGKNGSGKSSFYEALYFGLFGKPFRDCNKPDLLNWVNKKNAKVEVAFSVNGKKYLVKRGIKPNLFEIYDKDNKLIDQTSRTKDYQTYLEEDLLKMSSTAFLQIVLLGSSLFVPFMKLKTKPRRDFVEEFFNIEVFTGMNKIAKQKVSDLTTKGKEIAHQLKLVNVSIEHLTDFIAKYEAMQDSQNQQNKQEITDTQAALEKINEDISNYQMVLNDKLQVNYTDLIKDLIQEKDDLLVETSTYENNRDRLKRKADFLQDSNVCHSCGQDIEEDYAKTTIRDALDEMSSYTLMIDQKYNQRQKIQNKLSEYAKCMEDIASRKTKLKAAEHRRDMLQETLDSLTQKPTQNNDHIDEKRLELMAKRAERIDLKNKMQELFIDLKEYQKILELLRDDGVKSTIVKSYIPILNKLIDKYLKILGFPIKFTFDEHFNETIVYRGVKNLSYGSFSEGERSRIDLALLFAFREFAELRTGTGCNLLIFDEIGDSTLDIEGVEMFLSIIASVANKSNVFLISQKGEVLTTKFDKSLEFYKDPYFSKYKTY